ncbi:MAG: efflux transporter outer membrane subunit [Verrucomicrobiota bacterium]
MKPFLFSLFATTAAFAATPVVQTPTAFRDASTTNDIAAWKKAEPADTLARGEWWKLFADPALDDLIGRALANNQDLRAAAARVEQARAAAGLARSAYWPQLAANGSITREQTSDTVGNVQPNTLTTTYRAPLVASWEIDLFGRVRHLTASARADAEAVAATFESVRLTLTSDVAASYFTLRALDHELALVRGGVALRSRARELAQARLTNGTAAELDVARADAELASAEAESAAVANRRAALANSLAVLTGVPAPGFELPTRETQLALPPVVPAGLPAALLERRPDIAAAERALAAANSRIGVARAAFFPAISLTGSAGFASAEVDGLFKADSRIWSIGPSLYLPIFQGGRNRANLARSRAAHEESVAQFRQRVLVAFQEVQDALTAGRLLTEQSAAQERALTAARRATTLAQTRYDAGFVSFLEVIDAQRTSLATERASAQLAALRLNTAVALIKALGGGWHAAPAS